MKITEVKKGENYNRGRVMLAISGTEKELDFVSKMLADSDFSDASADYREEEDKEGMYNDCYVVDRSEVKEFKAVYMEIKTLIKHGDHLKEESKPVETPVTPSKPASPVKATITSPVVENGVESVVERSTAIQSVSINAIVNFCNVSKEEAVSLLERTKGVVIEAARLHKEITSNDVYSPPPTNKPPIVYHAEEKQDLIIVANRTRLIDEFTSTTGESKEVAKDYLETEEWIISDALKSFRCDQAAFKKANMT